MRIEEGKHYSIQYNSEDHIIAMFCEYCNFSIGRLECKPTKTGHRWPSMSHKIKKHLKGEHNINLYKKFKEVNVNE